MAELIQGDVVLLKVGEKIYGAATGLSLNITTETKESTKYKQKKGGWVGKKAVKNSWDASSDNGVFKLTDFDALMDLQIARASVSIEIVEAEINETEDAYTPKTGGWKKAGKGIITSLSLNAPVDDDATVSIKIEGDGEIKTPTA